MKIREGDLIKSHLTKEILTVSGVWVDGDVFCWTWPCTLYPVGTFDLIESCSDETHKATLEDSERTQLDYPTLSKLTQIKIINLEKRLEEANTNIRSVLSAIEYCLPFIIADSKNSLYADLPVLPKFHAFYILKDLIEKEKGVKS